MKRLLLFFALAYALSWLLWLPLWWPATLTEGQAFRFQHGLGGLGPMLAAFLMTGLTEGRLGLRRLAAGMVRLRRPVYLGVALLSPLVLCLLAFVIHYARTSVWLPLAAIGRTAEFPDFNLPAFFAYNLLFFGFGEEVGWRGYALPRLQTRFSALGSAVLLTLFWAGWHLPLFFYRPGYVNMDVGGIVGWLLSLLTGSVLLTWLFNATRGSILVCAVFHATVDIAFTSDGFNASDVVGTMGALITVWGIATCFLLKRREKVVAGLSR